MSPCFFHVLCSGQTGLPPCVWCKHRVGTGRTPGANTSDRGCIQPGEGKLEGPPVYGASIALAQAGHPEPIQVTVDAFSQVRVNLRVLLCFLRVLRYHRQDTQSQYE